MTTTTPQAAAAAAAKEILDDDEKQKVLNCVLQALESRNLRPLLVVISGSRAKGVSSGANSDYDMNIVAAHGRRQYMLQTVKPSFHFETEVDGLQVDIAVTDIVQLKSYILNNNMKAYDIFASQTIFTTEVAEQYRHVWTTQLYIGQNLLQSLNGMLYSYKKKKLFAAIKGDPNRTTRKLACEAVYLALKLFSIQSDPSTPPSYHMQDLLIDNNNMKVLDAEGSDIEDHGDRREYWVTQLIQQRIQDKDSPFFMTRDFDELVDQALEVKIVTQTTKEDSCCFRQELEDAFLSLFE
jgi:predicted nucleotidyltransferase